MGFGLPVCGKLWKRSSDWTGPSLLLLCRGEPTVPTLLMAQRAVQHPIGTCALPADSLEQQIPRFQANAQRWLKHVAEMQGMTTTEFYGIMARACEELDQIITTAAFHALSITGASCTDTVQSITRGKSPDNLTMGQCVQLLITLKSSLSRAVVARPISFDSPQLVFPKQLVALLQGISRTRNDFAHRRFPRNCANHKDRTAYIKAAIAGTHDFLTDGLRMTTFPFFLQLVSHDQNHEPCISSNGLGATKNTPANE